MTDLITRLRSLSRCEHDDLSVGDEAADEIDRLRALTCKCVENNAEVERLRADIGPLLTDVTALEEDNARLTAAAQQARAALSAMLALGDRVVLFDLESRSAVGRPHHYADALRALDEALK